MPQNYQSFLVRLWNVGQENERIEIEHIQSGLKRVLLSRTEAVEWMRTIDLSLVGLPGKEGTRFRPS
jgi:hypothetical protein